MPVTWIDSINKTRKKSNIFGLWTVLKTTVDKEWRNANISGMIYTKNTHLATKNIIFITNLKVCKAPNYVIVLFHFFIATNYLPHPWNGLSFFIVNIGWLVRYIGVAWAILQRGIGNVSKIPSTVGRDCNVFFCRWRYHLCYHEEQCPLWDTSCYEYNGKKD